MVDATDNDGRRVQQMRGRRRRRHGGGKWETFSASTASAQIDVAPSSP
jgi:hypothetical protein